MLLDWQIMQVSENISICQFSKLLIGAEWKKLFDSKVFEIGLYQKIKKSTVLLKFPDDG